MKNTLYSSFHTDPSMQVAPRARGESPGSAWRYGVAEGDASAARLATPIPRKGHAALERASRCAAESAHLPGHIDRSNIDRSSIDRSSEERVYTVDELARQFNVSPKTIARWRESGLVANQVVIDGHRRLGFSKSAVDRFVRENSHRIRRSIQLRHLTPDERQDIVENAARLVRNGQSRAEVIRQLAKETRRSVETIRQTIRQFDEQNPMQAVFAVDSGRLTDLTKQQIYQEFCQDRSLSELAKAFDRSEAQIHRVVQQARAARIRELPLDFMSNPSFKKAHASAEILGPIPPLQVSPRKARRPNDLPPYLASLYETPLLSKEQEVHLFRKYNYLKYLANNLRDQLDPQRPKVKLMEEIEDLYNQIVDTKNRIIRANLRLVVSIAKKYATQREGLFDLVSDGNMSLIKAVEKFDYALGNKFSTYATWAIKKNFARMLGNQTRRFERYRNGQEMVLSAATDERPDGSYQMRLQQNRESQVSMILDVLSDRERDIIKRRFGLNGYDEAHTLKEVGDELGVSKERIRQLEARALAKLHEAAVAAKIEDE